MGGDSYRGSNIGLVAQDDGCWRRAVGREVGGVDGGVGDRAIVADLRRGGGGQEGADGGGEGEEGTHADCLFFSYLLNRVVILIY